MFLLFIGFEPATFRTFAFLLIFCYTVYGKIGEGENMKKKYSTVYKIKMKDYDYRVLIDALNAYRLHQRATGIDNAATSQLLLKVLDAYGV